MSVIPTHSMHTVGSLSLSTCPAGCQQTALEPLLCARCYAPMLGGGGDAERNNRGVCPSPRGKLCKLLRFLMHSFTRLSPPLHYWS